MEATSEIENLGLGDVVLMEGEGIEWALHLSDTADHRSARGRNLVLLTDQRIIHLETTGRQQEAVFLSLRDIESVEIRMERDGYSGWIWGALALIGALALWRMWDNPFLSIVGAAALALMGVYLIVDGLTAAGTGHVTFKTGTTEVQAALGSSDSSHEIYSFVNRLYQLKGDAARDKERRPRAFAPR